MALKNIRGHQGIVSVPTLSAVVARIDRQHNGWWEVSRREDGRKEGDPPSYRLRALFTYVNQPLLKMLEKDDRFAIEFVVWLTAEKRYRVTWPDSERMAITGRTLFIEKGVQLVDLEGNGQA